MGLRRHNAKIGSPGISDLKWITVFLSRHRVFFLKMLRLNTMKRNREKMVIKSGRGVSTNKFVWRTRAYQANGFYFRDSNAGVRETVKILKRVENHTKMGENNQK